MKFDQPPRKIVYYPIPGDPKGGALFIYGDEKAKNMALMSAGFPDDQKPFIPFASRLANETDTLVGLICLPGFDDRADKPWTDHKRDKKDGYSFDEMATCFREAAKALRSESSSPTKPKFTGIFHDWGVNPGAMWANRAIADGSENAPNELVYFDVLMPPHPSTPDMPPADGKISIRQLLVNHYYQFVLGLAFGIQRYVANIFAIFGLIFGMIPLMVPCGISPTGKIDDDTRKELGVPDISHSIYMCYTYFNVVYRGEGYKKLLTHQLDEDYTLPQDLSKVPVLYMYGTDKSANFHLEQPLKVLQREHDEKRSKSKVVAVDGAGHYLYLQKPELCFDCVTEFMKED
mmetsp:Transcript_36877/g.66320  ORF Transcript_36877/g.66320 Transcript_36877/m.66320 type:complete len:346 (+) Transcript_36877:33-1070(+)